MFIHVLFFKQLRYFLKYCFCFFFQYVSFNNLYLKKKKLMQSDDILTDIGVETYSMNNN